MSAKESCNERTAVRAFAVTAAILCVLASVPASYAQAGAGEAARPEDKVATITKGAKLDPDLKARRIAAINVIYFDGTQRFLIPNYVKTETLERPCGADECQAILGSTPPKPEAEANSKIPANSEPRSAQAKGKSRCTEISGQVINVRICR
jgi:hypothetical protein